MSINILKGTKAYLAGPVERCNDSGITWRKNITGELSNLGIIVWDPLVKPNWHIEECGCELSSEIQKSDTHNIIDGNTISKESKSYIRNKLTRDVCLRLTCAADFIICYIDGPTIGTLEELYLAKSQNKPILFILNSKHLDSCWRAVQFPDAIYFKSTELLINYLINISTGSIHVDNKQWIFLPGAWPNAC